MRRKGWIGTILLVTVLLLGAGLKAIAQDDEGAAQPAGAMELTDDAAKSKPQTTGFLDVVTGAGFIGVVLWLGLLGTSVAGVALVVDSFITVQPKKITPDTLQNSVREAMDQGDVMKALQHCEQEPCPLANILSAGFSNVQEGYDVIQESVSMAADMESEKLMQRVTYLNVVGNIAPMLGLLGTVQGMIFAFATLATAAPGAAQQAALAMNISQALYTTAAGLIVAVPAVGFFYYFKNRATTIILGMEALTMDLIKALRNVEVVEE